MPLQLITTSDGSHSLLNTELNETYHSVHGAIQESKHVFIVGGLSSLPKTKGEEIKILEIGFGTGLNALLTWMYAEENQLKISYESWELFPLEKTIVDQLNYDNVLNKPDHLALIHFAKWNVGLL